MDIKTVLHNISKNLKNLREERKLSQLEVSHHLNMERRGYQKIEYGETKDIKLSTLLKIMEYFDVSFEDLVS